MPTYDYDELCFSYGSDTHEIDDQNVGPNGLKTTNRFTIGLTVSSIDINTLGTNDSSNAPTSISTRLHEVIFEYRFYQKLVCKSTDCQIKCPIKELTRISASHVQKKAIDPVSRQKTFWMYLILRISLIVVIATEMSLLKAAILTIVGKCFQL